MTWMPFRRLRNQSEQQELQAWRWLLSFERLASDTSVRLRDQQIIIRLCPGTLHASQSAPFIHLSASHPELEERIVVSGNSLYEAAEKLHYEFSRSGLQLPFLHGA